MTWQSLHDAWWRLITQHHPRALRDRLACRALSMGAVAYEAAIQARNAAYDHGWLRSVRLPCRVISVGNLTLGGTGKTACVELITRKLIAQDCRVVVLSRGYGGTRRSYWLQWERGQLLLDGHPSATDDGLADEPQLLARHLEGVPIVVNPQRAHGGQMAYAQLGARVLVLDDAFQHRRLQRDCDVVLVHARTPLGGWAVFPRGPMREPLGALKRADVIIVTKIHEALEMVGALQERLQALNPQAAVLTAAHEPVRLVDAITGQSHDLKRLNGLRVGLLSSIGDPEGFEVMVRRLHATVLWHRIFPDHHRYQEKGWDGVLIHQPSVRPEVVVTTEKDWTRLQALVAARPGLDLPLWVLEIEMKLVSGEAELDARLARLCLP